MSVAVVVARNGRIAVCVEEVQHRGKFEGSFDYGLFVRVRYEPKGPVTRLGFSLDPIFLPQFKEMASKRHIESDRIIDQVAEEALGDYLDESGLPPFVGAGESCAMISANEQAQGYFERTKGRVSTDEEALAYMAAKVYWSWRFGWRRAVFTEADARRLVMPVDDFARIGIAGDDVYWSRSDSAALDFEALPRLLNEFPAGLFPGMEEPLLHRVGDRLAAPRYAASNEHLKKALGFLGTNEPDLPNAVKEATTAVEALALRVLDRSSGTLGDSIKELRSRGLLSPPLSKALEGLWGFSSEEPGVRHGKTTAPALRPHEGRFAINLAASALVLLLELDT